MIENFQKVQSITEYNNQQQSCHSSKTVQIQEIITRKSNIEQNNSKFLKNLKARRKIAFEFFIFVSLSAMLLIISSTLFLMAYQEITQNTILRQFSHQIYNKQNLGLEFGKTNFTVRDLNQGVNGQQIITNSFFQGDSRFIYKSFLYNNQKFRKVDFNKLESFLSNTVAFETFTFTFNYTLENQWKNRKIQLEIQDVKKTFENLSDKNENFLQNIALQQLKKDKTEIDSKNYQLQYLYADKKYQIGNQSRQLPFCLFTYGSTVNSEDMHRYFQSIQNLNYTNFRIVYVNEFTTELIKNNGFAYLKTSEMRIKNRFIMVNNFQNMGPLASMYFWVKRFCDDNDIVLVLGKDQEIIGRQALKILNSIYLQPNIWSTSFNFYRKQDIIIQVNEESINQNQDNQYEETNLHLRTFRRQLIDSIPVQSLMGFKYSQQKKQVWPAFYKSSLNQFLDYFQIDNIGKEKNLQLRQFLILANTHLKQCQKQYQDYHKELIKLNSPLIFNELGNKAKIYQNYNEQQMRLAKQKEQLLFQCQNKNKIKNENP